MNMGCAICDANGINTPASRLICGHCGPYYVGPDWGLCLVCYRFYPCPKCAELKRQNDRDEDHHSDEAADARLGR